MSPGAWRPLGAGSLTEVWTDGERVRRPLRPSSPAVHRVLRRLEDAGVAGVPRLLGRSEGEEYLSLIAGEAIRRPWPEAALRVELLYSIGRLLGAAHRATAGLTLRPGERFAWGPQRPDVGEVVCHGDLGPWNVLLRGDDLAGLIDWDLARFGQPIEDLVDAAVELAPLRQNVGMAPADRLTRAHVEARLRALCEGHGAADPARVVDEAPRLLRMRAAQLRAFASASPELLEPLLAREVDRELERDADWIAAHWRDR